MAAIAVPVETFTQFFLDSLQRITFESLFHDRAIHFLIEFQSKSFHDIRSEENIF